MRIWHAALAVSIGVGAVLAAAEPADAHGVAGIQPSNFSTRVLSVRPRVAGLRVRAADLGNKLEVDNRSGRDVTVLGYDGEPYLRVGPGGAFENIRSPAVYLNRTRTGNVAVPRSADPHAPPEWRRTGDGPIVRWHDHRAHWFATSNPLSVQRDPGSQHLVQRFTVTLVRDGVPIVVRGEVLWVPGPAPWAWVVLAAALAVLLVALARTRAARPAVAAALLAMIGGQVAHVLGSYAGTTVAGTTKLAASAYGLGGIAIGAVAFVWVVRRGVRLAAPLLLLAGMFLALAGGLTDVTELYRSQLPTALPHVWSRLEVAVVLGLGVGTAVAGALRLRVTPPPARRPAPARPPLEATTR
jgi:hypothetical protein